MPHDHRLWPENSSLHAVLLAFCLFSSLFAGCALSEEPKAEKKTPAEVFVGVYVNQIYELNVKDSHFVADFWIWFRWKDDSLKPLDTFRVVGGREVEKEHEMQDPEKKNGFNYAQARVRANISKIFDVGRFPLDNHTLFIQIDEGDSAASKLIYLPDVENSGYAKDVQVPGWVLKKGAATAETQVDATNYGAPNAAKQTSHARFQYAIDIVRPGWGSFFKLYLAAFLSTLIAIMAFKIHPAEMDARYALGITAIIGVLTSQFIVLQGMPDTEDATLPDKFHALALIFVLFTIAQTAWCKHLCHHKKEALAKMADQICFYGSTILYLALNVLITL